MRLFKDFSKWFWAACLLDWLPIAICWVVIVLILALLRINGIDGFQVSSVLLNTQFILVCILFAQSIKLLCSLLLERPDSPIAFSRTFVQDNLHWAILARHMPIIISLCAFMPVFSAMKASISLFVDYNWDNSFTYLDQLIHGRDAWKLIHPVVGFPLATFTLNLFYNLWIVTIYAGTVFLGLRLSDPQLRQQFLITYFSCWSFLGVAGAISFASVGPAFVGPLLDQNRFDPLIAYLGEANSQYRIISVEVQTKLIDQFWERNTSLGAGITAMPSMHVSMSFLFFLAMRHISRLAAWLSAIFFVAILIGSVHLAYHYAVDGYVSIVATALIWRLSGWWSTRGMRQ